MDFNRKFVDEAIRFIVVGGISFLIDFSVLVALQEAGLKNVRYGVLISTTMAFGVSMAVHYFLATFWVFRGHDVNNGRRHARAAALFVITNVFGCLLNNLFMFLGVSLLGFHYVPVKLFATVAVMFWNYACQKFFIYRREEA
jgi:putative flippase GtrA